MLPLLKREALERALYSCVEMGANEIRLVVTKKTTREWGGEKEFARLQRIIISAAEQSKNFSIPLLYQPERFETVIDNSNSDVCLFADPEGVPIGQVLKNTISSITILVGVYNCLCCGNKNATV